MGTELLGLLILSSLYVQQAATPVPVAYAQAPVQPLVEMPQPRILELETPNITGNSGKTPKPTIPGILEKVAFCESGGRQFDKYGNVKLGIVDKRDIGKWQINTYWWGAEAKRLGHDIWTLEGNTAMALHIHKVAGLGPWKASRPCWSV